MSAATVAVPQTPAARPVTNVQRPPARHRRPRSAR